ncbi:MAG: ribosome biogenesis GTPase Der [Thermodesulfobacteriota bacterium]
MKPIVAIVGRPNVGKSTLFNRISRQRRALVDDTPGVTRDRIYNEVVWNGKGFILVDTGGFEPATKEPLLSLVREQTELAIEEADLILFLMDAKDGPTASDMETAALLRRTSKPVFYVVNKVDGERHDPSALLFYELGAERVQVISAKYGRGVSDLLDQITMGFPQATPPAEKGGDEIRVAVVGRPNVGKSSLVNRLLGEDRSLVSPIPGTTRDSVDSELRWHGKRLVLIDTAGIRRKSRIHRPLDKYCVMKALKGIERCDVAVLLLDATQGVTDQDATIGGYILERGRGCVVLVNKWDLIAKDHRTHEQYVEEVRRGLRHLDFAPVLTVSAYTGLRVRRLLEWVNTVHESCLRRVPTPALNRSFRKWISEQPPPIYRGRRARLYYMTQPQVAPPTFVAFSNAPEAISDSYRRYLVHRIREEFDFIGATIRVEVRERPRGRRHKV